MIGVLKMNKFSSAITRVTLALLLIGSISIVTNFNDFVTSFEPAISFEDLLDGEQVEKGDHIAGDVVFSFPPFASESTYTEYKDGTRGTSEASGNYYVIPTAEEPIALKTKQESVEAMDQLTDETFDYLQDGPEPTTQAFCEGKVIEMDDEELLDYYHEYLLDFGYTEAEIEAMGTPLLIQCVDFQLVRIMFIGGIVFVLLGIGFIIRRHRMQCLEEESEL